MKASTSSENVTSWLNIVELNWYERFFELERKQLKFFAVKCFRCPDTSKTIIHVTDRTKMTAKKTACAKSANYCFKLSIIQICDILVSIICGGLIGSL